MGLTKSGRTIIAALSFILFIAYSGSGVAGGADKNQVCISNDVGSGFQINGWFNNAQGQLIGSCCNPGSSEDCRISTAQTICCKMTGTRSGDWQEGAYFGYAVYQGNGSGKVYPDLGETCHFSGQLGNIQKSKQCKRD